MEKTETSETKQRKKITTFASYQRMVERTDERKQRTIALMGLVGEIGDLHSMMKKLLLQRDNPTFRTELCEEFGDVLWYLTSLASLYKIPLQEIAETNAIKAESLYSSGGAINFDAGYPPAQQLPRQFTACFSTKKNRVRIYVDGKKVGDSLTDNSHVDDGYRFHDVFHLAYAAILGWSPVTRKLLNRKRRDDPRIDEIEDGGRAAIVEEAISIYIFNQAEQRGWYMDLSAIDIGLLKMIRKMAGGLEVKACTAKQWQQAIHQGYVVFDALKKNLGGEVQVDLDNQRLDYRQQPIRSKGKH